MKQRRRHTARSVLGKHFLFQAKRDQHFDGRRMDRGGTLILGGIRQLLDQRDGNTFFHQRQRHHRADRPAA